MCRCLHFVVVHFVLSSQPLDETTVLIPLMLIFFTSCHWIGIVQFPFRVLSHCIGLSLFTLSALEPFVDLTLLVLRDGIGLSHCML